MHHLFFLSALDSSSGRVSKSTLSDQELMEIVFGSLDQAESFKENGLFKDVCDWKIVKCNADRRVVRVSSALFIGKGIVMLDYIPELVTRFGIPGPIFGNKEIVGALETNSLPNRLKIFQISANAFYGTVDVPNLPRTLEMFNISNNAFSGTLDMGNLPPNLEFFGANGNAFSGVFCLVSIPHSLVSVDASNNKFEREALFSAVQMVQLRLYSCHPSVETVLDENGNRHPDEVSILTDTQEKRFY